MLSLFDIANVVFLTLAFFFIFPKVIMFFVLLCCEAFIDISDARRVLMALTIFGES